MKNTILAPLVVLTIISALFGQSPVFRYRADRVPVGTVFHYLKTNVDGSQPENISLYIAAADRIESFKYHEKGSRAGLVKAEMDWKNFIARRLESWQVFSRSDRKLFAVLTYDDARNSAVVSIPAARPEPETVAIDRVPFHLYNFDLASLNISFAHLVDPKKPFTVGIADPTFKSEGPFVAYKGDLEVKYERNESRNGVRCRRYSAAGPGIGGQGTIWVSVDRPMVQDMEFDVANNPDWKTFKLKLLRTEKMTRDGWQEFIASRF